MAAQILSLLTFFGPLISWAELVEVIEVKLRDLDIAIDCANGAAYTVNQAIPENPSSKAPPSAGVLCGCQMVVYQLLLENKFLPLCLERIELLLQSHVALNQRAQFFVT
jgi:hypothetical protein